MILPSSPNTSAFSTPVKRKQEKECPLENSPGDFFRRVKIPNNRSGTPPENLGKHYISVIKDPAEQLDANIPIPREKPPSKKEEPTFCLISISPANTPPIKNLGNLFKEYGPKEVTYL